MTLSLCGVSIVSPSLLYLHNTHLTMFRWFMILMWPNRKCVAAVLLKSNQSRDAALKFQTSYSSLVRFQPVWAYFQIDTHFFVTICLIYGKKPHCSLSLPYLWCWGLSCQVLHIWCFSGDCWHADLLVCVFLSEGAELVPQTFVFLWDPLHSTTLPLKHFSDQWDAVFSLRTLSRASLISKGK